MANKKKARKKKISLWIQGARLRTLPLAVAPIAVGYGAAAVAGAASIGLTVLALLVALCLQIGVNYANDFSDGIRGTDNNRVGPLRLTGSGSIKPAKVKRAAFIFFGLAAIAGLSIVVLTGFWWLLAVGALAIVAAWYYTGGNRPYGYSAMGEISVFVFFGLVATMGTSYIQLGLFDGNSLIGGIAVGCFAAAVLMVNNIRDLDLDRHVGKKTLAVFVGRKVAKAMYIALIWAPFILLGLFVLIYPATFFAFAAIFIIAPATLIVITAKQPSELILALKLTSLGALVYGLLLGVGLSVVTIG